MRTYLWGLSLGTGSGGKPCRQPSGWPARSGASSAGPHQIHFTINIKLGARNKKYYCQTSWGILIYSTMQSDISRRLLLRQENRVQTEPPLHHKKCELYNSTFHDENSKMCCSLAHWKQGHTLHKRGNPAVILRAYLQTTRQHLPRPRPVQSEWFSSLD